MSEETGREREMIRYEELKLEDGNEMKRGKKRAGEEVWMTTARPKLAMWWCFPRYHLVKTTGEELMSLEMAPCKKGRRDLSACFTNRCHRIRVYRRQPNFLSCSHHFETPRADLPFFLLLAHSLLICKGNHAQALALAARESGMPAHIVMPSVSPPNKVAATKGYGARVIFSGSTSVEREAVADEVIAETGARLVPPYDHPDIILGQGTMGIELQTQVKEM